MSVTVPSAPSPFIELSYQSNYAIVSLKREPVNSMNLDVWAGLNHALETVEADPKMRGIILTSALTRDVFTAGNDINELYSKNTSGDRYIQFWRAQTYFLSRLYQSRLLTMAVIPGQCPAGGCAVAMVCDVRFMANDGNYRIGLNEVALGIPVPLYWGRLLLSIVGKSIGEEMLLNAVMLTTNEARSSGLIHYAMPKAELMDAAKKEMIKRLKYADSGRIATKMQIRTEFAKGWQNYCQKEAEEGWKMLASPKTTAALGAVLQRLQGGAQKNQKNEQTKAKL